MKTIHDTYFSLNFSTAVFQWEKKVKREIQAHLNCMCVLLIIYWHVKETRNRFFPVKAVN